MCICPLDHQGDCHCYAFTGRHEHDLYHEWAARRDEWERNHPEADAAEKLAAIRDISHELIRVKASQKSSAQ